MVCGFLKPLDCKLINIDFLHLTQRVLFDEFRTARFMLKIRRNYNLYIFILLLLLECKHKTLFTEKSKITIQHINNNPFKFNGMKTKMILLLVMALFSFQVFATDSALKTAVMGQDFEKTKAALDAGGDPNEMISSAPVLVWAARQGRIDVMQLLIEKGAKVDGIGLLGITALAAIVEDNKMPADYVAENEKLNKTMLKRIKEDVLKANGWWKVVDVSVFSTPVERAKVLLDAGANPNFLLGNMSVKVGTPFLNAVKDGKIDLVKTMLASGKVDTELRFDQWLESTIQFVNVLEAGKYDNKQAALDWAKIPKYNTPLLFAIESQNLEMVKILVEGGANVNVGKKVETKYWELWNPLDVAMNAKNPNKEIIDFLVSKGAVESKLSNQ